MDEGELHELESHFCNTGFNLVRRVELVNTFFAFHEICEGLDELRDACSVGSLLHK
jgi:hypothetical protein